MIISRYNHPAATSRHQSISRDDVMHASVVQGGKELFNINISGITSMAEILKAIRTTAIDLAGIIVVKIRNCSQGWSQSKSLLIA